METQEMRIMICDNCGREGDTEGDIVDGWESIKGDVTCLECRLRKLESQSRANVKEEKDGT